MCFTKYTDFRCAKCNHLLSWKTDHECYEHPGDPRKGCRIIIQRTGMPRSNKTCRKCKRRRREAGRKRMRHKDMKRRWIGYELKVCDSKPNLSKWSTPTRFPYYSNIY
ncbi:hypothetical protein HZ326_6092 [Fusarium oxysporum f. sp. albedinis]|nr:hypothetical protein HZ326_6092 [Fusarium oxysporum f. sp. albedinis]